MMKWLMEIDRRHVLVPWSSNSHCIERNEGAEFPHKIDHFVETNLITGTGQGYLMFCDISCGVAYL